MTKLLVVVGATGMQGGSVINWFQQHESTWRIRGLTRDPSSAAASDLAKSGIEMVKADLFDLDSLQAAFRGANYIFAFTDFGALMKGALARFQAGEIAAPIGAETYRLEASQGRNIADAAATVPELERLVFSTEPNVKRLSGGKYEHVYHFDAKAAGLEYMLGLDALKGKVSAVMLGVFVASVKKIQHLWGLKMVDRIAVWSPPFEADLPLPWVDVQRDLGSFVEALIRTSAPTQVFVVSEWLSGQQWLDQWTKVTGVQARYEAGMSLHERVDKDPTGLSLHFSQTMRYIEDFGYTCGDPSVLMPEELEAKGCSVHRTGVADYIDRESWSEIVRQAS
ncbi:hypothetical protein LTR78_010906 [Recurvomyces mirabilis]|uniref:NmrA-like domain-containing protein n=1 Tax=Recurvomyces mirabilis TaxID=574656 RepID=A0AAE0TLV1_9PEZI|nr:hypothetical protein LTR78_010906 [Recurvomyces mirabilis]KAK5149905.1 hypothetical protein LTS14_010510 [Recurvomyces mirabilis]